MYLASRLLLLFAIAPRLIVALLFLNSSNPYLVFSPLWHHSHLPGQSIVYRSPPDLALSAYLPENTSTLIYIGHKSARGSRYGVCVDCGVAPSPSKYIAIFDGHSPSSMYHFDPKPSVIFALKLDPTIKHTVSVINVPDLRFGGMSELSFVSLAIIMENSGPAYYTSPHVFLPTDTSHFAGPTTSPPSPTTSTSASTWSPSYAPPSIGPSQDADAANDPQGLSKSLSIAIISLLVVAILPIVVGSIIYFRNKRSQNDRLSTASSGFWSIDAKQTLAPSEPMGSLAAAGRKRPSKPLLYLPPPTPSPDTPLPDLPRRALPGTITSQSRGIKEIQPLARAKIGR